MATINLADYITTNDFAAKLNDGTQVDTISLYCSRGKIEAVQIGRAWLIHKREFEKFVKMRKPRGRPRKAV